MRSIATTMLFGAAVLPAAAMAQTQTSAVTPLRLTSTSYSQNFNSLAASGTSSALPAGFQVSETGDSTTTVNGAYTAGTGSSSTGDAYSFGTDGDRALGTLLSGSNAPSFGAIFENGLGSAITALTFNFTGEQWRSSVNADRLDFQYAVGVSSIAAGTWTDFDTLDITSVVSGTNTAQNGNTTNRQYSATISRLNIAANQRFGFRFLDFDVSGADAGLALDDLTITAAIAAVPEPATWAMMLLGFALIGGTMRRRGGVRRVLA